MNFCLYIVTLCLTVFPATVFSYPVPSQDTYTMYRNAARFLAGWQYDGVVRYTWPGSSLSSNSVEFLGEHLQPLVPKIAKANWVVSWRPNSTTASPNKIRLVKYSDPGNLTQIAEISMANSSNEAFVTVDITDELRDIILWGENVFLGHQTLVSGQGQGPYIYISYIDVVWKN